MPSEPETLAQVLARRRRGGQRGNHNALKHGFYAHHFNPADLKDLENSHFTGLEDEIAMLRVQIRRIIALCTPDQTITEAAFTLRILCLATLSINRLIRTQAILGTQGQGNEVADALHQALSEMGMGPGGPVSRGEPPSPYTP